MNNALKLKNHRNAVAIALLVMHFLLGSNLLKGQESMTTFINGSDTVVVYKDVPGLQPSEFYEIRVRSEPQEGNGFPVMQTLLGLFGKRMPPREMMLIKKPITHM